MALNERVRIARRFQRAIRIDADAHDAEALEGFVCLESSASVLLTTAQHVAQTGQGAFTWTGPYGSGKSSLVVALSALLGRDKGMRTLAEKVIGKSRGRTITDHMPRRRSGWRVLPVVGRRASPAEVIGEAMKEAGIGFKRRPREWSDERVVAALTDAAQEDRYSGGVLLFVDEMGKFLEAAANDGTDLYLFQLLAEAASRSDGRLVVIGVLHQAFDEYASRLTQESRDEWSKIQGRFIDLAVNAAGEEQIELIGRAIQGRPSNTTCMSKLVKTVTTEVKRRQPSASDNLSKRLERCWPLHPVTACLLGPISRRRFGQNQRSIFGFLNSAEPFGFREFIRSASDSSLYEPDQLWDYLRENLEPSILASPDGHRWALAAEAIERCKALSEKPLPVQLLKAVAIIDLFRERSGVSACPKILRHCIDDASIKDIDAALKQLAAWSLIVYRKFNDSYAVFAGSDFDIEQALSEALEKVTEVDFQAIKRIAGLQPILAKRHYHQTGALRWFDMEVAPTSSLVEYGQSHKPKNGVIGQFVLVVSNEGETDEQTRAACREAAKSCDDWDLVVGGSQQSWSMTKLVREVSALEDIRDTHPELSHDPVARREVEARLTTLQGQLEHELQQAFDSAVWHVKYRKPDVYPQAELSAVASDLADRRYSESPKLHNELLNRIRPSSNANAALNTLLRLMVSNEGQDRLGIEGFPAEGGLFESLLKATGLYRKIDGKWRFEAPCGEYDQQGLSPLWGKSTEYLKDAADRTVEVSELYDVWRKPPFGVRDGLMPFLAVALILSQRNKIALYREGVFQSSLKDIDVEILTNDASDIQLRWMELSKYSRKLLSSMAKIVRDMSTDKELIHPTPIDVARGLIAIYDRLPPWTKRTMRLSAKANKVRDLFKRAHDPNKFLFNEIPSFIGDSSGQIDDMGEEAGMEIVENVRDGLDELVRAYPSMLQRLSEMMLAELQVPNASSAALAELRDRAENIRQLVGDFQIDAFIGRIATFQGEKSDIEDMASLAARKPLRDWVDVDLDRATIEIADMAQKFLRAETFTRVKGRRAKRQSMAVIIGIDERPSPVQEEFAISDTDRSSVQILIEQMEQVIEGADVDKRDVILAAIAELGARHMNSKSGQNRKLKKRSA